MVLPKRVLIAEGHCRKLQCVLEIDTDVHVLGMGGKVSDFGDYHVRKNTARPKDDQEPHDSISSQHIRRSTILKRLKCVNTKKNNSKSLHKIAVKHIKKAI